MIEETLAFGIFGKIGFGTPVGGYALAFGLASGGGSLNTSYSFRLSVGSGALRIPRQLCFDSLTPFGLCSLVPGDDLTISLVAVELVRPFGR